MSGFWTDLNRELEKYERAEAEDEAAREEFGDDYADLERDPEERDLISEDDVIDEPTNLARTA